MRRRGGLLSGVLLAALLACRPRTASEIAPAEPESIPGERVERFAPAIQALYPPDAYAGTPFATNFEGLSILGVAGKQFSPGCVVYFGGDPVRTQFISSQALTATLAADRIAKPGTVPVTVVETDGSASPAVPFRIQPPRSEGACPEIRELYPPGTKSGSGFAVRPNGSSSLGVAGGSFGPGTVVRFDGSDVRTIYQGPGSLIGVVPAAMLVRPRRVEVTVGERGCRQSSPPIIFTVR